MGKLLVEEPPLIVLPTLAKSIGLNEAIFLQQIHYWLQRSNHVISGRKWIYNSYPDWEKQFPFWSKRTLIRIIKSLDDQGLITIGQYNKYKVDKTNWYTINYEKVYSIVTTCHHGSDNLSVAIPETTTHKKKYASSVNLFITEYEELIEKYGPEKTNEMIELLNNYKEAHGKKYKSDYHAILQWVVQEVTGNKKRLVRHEKEIDFRQREIALNRWIEEGNDPNDFTY
ncbi:DnaD domain protein [Robertmurraya yapensis]|uniref:DnaD domain protein n=1 Tax=Bacillus sp. CECT 9360 TaxID=2845821 RepID=UPI00319D8C6A